MLTVLKDMAINIGATVIGWAIWQLIHVRRVRKKIRESSGLVSLIKEEFRRDD